MGNQLLTVGMATYDDAFGVWTTISSIREHHPDVPIVVIDTKPGGCRRTRGNVMAAGGKYYHRPDLAGTAAPRDAVFRLAKTPWVMVLDSHVIMRAGAIATAIQYAEDNPESVDLIQGPLIGDDGGIAGTHWRQTTHPGLWGVWDTIPRKEMPINRPFPIHAQGLGQFMMRRAAWPGFHPLHRGFGAEEGYIHEKVRQNGGDTLCHPGIGWRHYFRDMENGAPPPPYPLKTDDMVWNLLVTHRELGIEAEEAIFKDFGKNIPQLWPQMTAEARQVQPLGVRQPLKPQLRILGIWYSNNAAPAPLMAKSLDTIRIAKESATRHDVEVTTCSWGPVGANPFPWVAAKRTAQPGHATILEQQRQCVELAGEFDWQVICFLEHDTLYPADYFDRIGNAFAGANGETLVVSNLDYEGLNKTGWLAVTERHEPMHQLSLWRPFAEWNFQRCQDDCDRQGWCYLEPQGDRSNWVRIPPSAGQRVSMPSIHVNFDGRFTSHGEVCYEQVAKTTTHPHWGRFEQFWPGKPEPAVTCGSCATVSTSQFANPAEWLAAVSTAAAAPDCWEHLATVRDLAAKCIHVTELNIWGSPWLAAILAGGPKEVVTVAGGPMPNWDIAQRIPESARAALSTIINDSVSVEIPETDMLLTDTHHTGTQLLRELTAHAAKVRRFIVIHDTAVFGEVGDDGSPGLLHGIRHWVRRNPEWSVIRHDDNNNGLTVLSRLDQDKPTIEAGTWKKLGTFVAAMTKHVAGGMETASPDIVERRLDVCALCPLRRGSQCSKCGCELETSPIGGPGKAFLPAEQCPVGKW